MRNLPVIVKMTNIIDKVACGYGTLSTTAVKILQQVVLAMVANFRIGSGWGSTQNRTVATGHTTRKTRPTGNGPVLAPKTQHINITTWPAIKYLSCDRIMTQSVCRLCSVTGPFTSQSQICDLTNIGWVTSEYLQNFSEIVPCFHSRSTNISQIANQKARGEKAARIAQSMYWSCYNTMKTKMLIWRQRCRNRKVATTVRFQHGRKTAGLCSVWVTTPPRQSRSGFWPGHKLNRTDLPAKTRPLAGYPDPLLTLATSLKSPTELCAEALAALENSCRPAPRS
jgi:hypothetical protein